MITKGLQNSIRRIFHSRDCNLSEMQTDRFIKEHILKCNFLIGRVLSSGVYLYSKYLSISPTEEEREFSAKMEKYQKRYSRLDEKEEEFQSWKKSRKAINRIIEKKKKDVENGEKSYAIRGIIRNRALLYPTGGNVK